MSRLETEPRPAAASTRLQVQDYPAEASAEVGRGRRPRQEAAWNERFSTDRSGGTTFANLMSAVEKSSSDPRNTSVYHSYNIL
eukprot:gene21882-28915_t